MPVIDATPHFGVKREGPRKSKHKQRAKPDWHRLEQFYRTGASFDELAKLPEAAGRTKQAIFAHAKKEGWTRGDLTQEARIKARQELAIALAAAQEASDAEARPAPENPDAAEAEQTVKALAKNPSRQDAVFDATVKVHVAVGKRQCKHIERLRGELDELMDLYGRWKDLPYDDQERHRIGARLFGVKDTEADLQSKLIKMSAQLQGMERVAFSMDAKEADDKPQVQPFVPVISRRGTPGFSTPVNANAVDK